MTNNLGVERHTGGFFMSSQEEAAIKWGMFEEYKRLNGRYDAIHSKVQVWANAMEKVGAALRSPHAILSQDLSGLPEKLELVGAQQEMKSIEDTLVGLRDKLRRAGMDIK